MINVKNIAISIALVCVCAFVITACKPKNANNNTNTADQILENTEIVTDFIADNSRNPNDRIQIGDFVVMGSMIVAYYGSERDVTIPEEIKVDSIGWGSFSHGYVTSITIPAWISSIDDRAFENCHPLQSINVSENNQHYASVDGALFNKSKTNMIYFPHGKKGSFTIPDTVTAINDYAFNARSELTSIIIPASVTDIGSNVFDETVRLTSITVDRNNRSYASVDGVLFNKDVTEFVHFPHGKTGTYTIPNTMKGLDAYALRGRSGITSVNIPNTVTSIGDGTFYECSSLTSINIPGSVTVIFNDAFYGCTALTTVTLHEGLTRIENRAFFDCPIISINIPASVTKIGKGLFAASDKDNWYYSGSENFSGSSSLTTITVDQGNQDFTAVDGVLFNKSVTELVHFPQGKGGSYVIPNTVTNIEDFAFSYRNGLNSITIPASVTSIGEDAFFGCSNLTSITVDQNNSNYSSDEGVLFDKNKRELIRFPRGKRGSYVIPNTVVTIAKNAFARTSGLTSITIPSSVTQIMETAFASTGLKSLSLPNSITHIGQGAFTNNYELEIVNLPDNYRSYEEDGKGGSYFFYGCLNLKQIIASRNNKHYSTVDGVLLSKNKKRLIRYPYGKQGPYTIPSTVTSIAYKAFYKTEGLTFITIPKSVKIIGDFAFDGSGITSLDIPENVTSIGKYAFTRCLKLNSVNIPANVTNIGDFAFYHCTSLKEINGDPTNTNYFLAVNER